MNDECFINCSYQVTYFFYDGYHGPNNIEYEQEMQCNEIIDWATASIIFMLVLPRPINDSRPINILDQWARGTVQTEVRASGYAIELRVRVGKPSYLTHNWLELAVMKVTMTWNKVKTYWPKRRDQSELQRCCTFYW